MNERWTELPVVVAARWALSQALRQWKYYADEISRVDHRHALGSGNELEDKLYTSAAKAAEGLEAAADESAKASLAPKTAFASSAWLEELEAALRTLGKAEEKCRRELRYEDLDAVVRGHIALSKMLYDERGHSSNAELSDAAPSGGTPEAKL